MYLNLFFAIPFIDLCRYIYIYYGRAGISWFSDCASLATKFLPFLVGN